jgi:hypothetical protein
MTAWEGDAGEGGTEENVEGEDRKGYIATHWTENARTTALT